MDNLIKTFCTVDNFCELFIPAWELTLIDNGDIKRRRANRMASAEIMTILIGFYTITLIAITNFVMS